jgi:glutamyl-tRNA reductase
MPPFDRIRSHAERHCETELVAARKRLSRGEDPLSVMQALSAGLANKLLHPPLRALNHAAGAQGKELVQSLVSLYLP